MLPPRIAVLAVALAGLLALAGPAFATLEDGKPDPTWGTNGRVYAVVRIGGTVYVGGSFTAVLDRNGNSYPRNYLAAFDAATGVATAWNPVANGWVYSMAATPDGSRLFAGGKFTTIDGTGRSHLAAFESLGGVPDPILGTWKVTVGGAVKALTVSTPFLYLGGGFTKVANSPHSRIARVNLSTAAVDGAWNPSTDGEVRSIALAQNGSKVFIGGFFQAVNGQTRKYLAALDPTVGGLATGQPSPKPNDNGNRHLGTTLPCTVWGLVTDATRLYAACFGQGSTIWEGALGFDVATGNGVWSRGGDGGVQAITMLGSYVYIGGHLTCFAGICDGQHQKLYRIDAASGTVDASWPAKPNSGPGVFALSSYGGQYLYAGGDFTSVTGIAQDHVAQFSMADLSAPSAPGTPASTGATPTQIDLSWGASDDNVGVTAYDVFRDGEVVGSTEGTVTVFTDSGLDPATTHSYFIRARDAAGNASSPSATVDLATLADTTAPTAPSGLAATGIGSTWVDLSWAASTDDVGVAGYEIRRGPDVIAQVPGTVLGLLDSGLSPLSSYQYTVLATDAAGNRSDPATDLSVVTSPPALFSDDFEAGNLSKWPASAGVAVEPGSGGSNVAHAAATQAPAYARADLPAPRQEIAFTVRLKPVSQGSNVIVLQQGRTSANGIVYSIVVAKSSRALGFTDRSGATVYGSTTVALGAWHTLECHVVVGGASSVAEVWLDGVRVGGLPATVDLGTSPIGKVQIGDSASRTADVQYDDVDVTATP